jgi:menaquinone-dependent protoporphyrinogen IX oxidase
MERKRITCPETGHLEQIDLERTPLGLLIAGCSRFRRPCTLGCSRECAKRMDRRDHRDVDDQDRVLIVVAGAHALTAQIADVLTDDLKLDGLVVERATLDDGVPPPLSDYDAVVLGAPVQLRRGASRLADYVREQATELATIPAFLFVVGNDGWLGPSGYIARMIHQTGWHPTAVAAFADDAAGSRPALLDFAHCVADEIPTAAVPLTSG